MHNSLTEEWHKAIDIDLHGVFYPSRVAITLQAQSTRSMKTGYNALPSTCRDCGRSCSVGSLFLSPAASYITGTEVVIDGGLGSSNNQPNIPGIFAAM